MTLRQQLPPETFQNILRWAEDFEMAIKVESIFAGVLSKLPPKETAYDGFRISDFPISRELTETFTLFPVNIDPSTVSLSVIAWLLRFQPEIFWRRGGNIVRGLAAKGRLKALKLIGSNAHVRSQAFEWGEMDDAARAGHLNVVTYLRETLKVPFTSDTLQDATWSGNLALVQYLHNLEAECSVDVLSKAFESKNPDVIRFILESYGKRTFAFACWNDGVKTSYPELDDLIIKTDPQFGFGSVLKSAQEGNLERLSHWFEMLEQANVSNFPFDQVIGKGQLNAVKYLVEEKGIRSTANAVFHSAEQRNLEALRYLLDQDPSLSATGAFATACEKGNLDMVKYLHETNQYSCINISGPSCNCICSFSESARRGKLEVLQYLRQNCREFDDQEAVECALAQECFLPVQIVKYLAPFSDLTSGMPSATFHGNMEVVRLILSQWQSQDVDIHTIDTAAKSEKSLEAIQYLHSTGRFDFTETALVNASARGHFKTVQFLVKVKPEISLLRSLTAALIFWNPTIFSYLERNLKPAERKIWNPTPSLTGALEIGKIKAIRYILKRDPHAMIPPSLVEYLISDDDEFFRFDDFDMFEFLAAHSERVPGIETNDEFFEVLGNVWAWDGLRILLKDPVRLESKREKLAVLHYNHVPRERIVRYVTDQTPDGWRSR
ncbi:hypothetical protein HDU97_008837 [Phlyctochytrium planicorne]|nr:hypothetical protein HDU97_008837 [Phlyctochytrium planicorne]